MKIEGQKLVGKDVRIMNRKDFYYGSWATIIAYDGTLYQAKLKNPPHLVLDLARSEFWVLRGQKE